MKAAVAKSWIAFPFGRIACVKVCGKRLFASEVHTRRRQSRLLLERHTLKPAFSAIGLVASRVPSKTRRHQAQGIGHTHGRTITCTARDESQNWYSRLEKLLAAFLNPKSFMTAISVGRKLSMVTFAIHLEDEQVSTA